ISPAALAWAMDRTGRSAHDRTVRDRTMVADPGRGCVLRDVGRSKVYLAEDFVFDETLYAETLGMAGVASLADHLFIDDWWVNNISRYPEIVSTRREANRSHADI